MYRGYTCELLPFTAILFDVNQAKELCVTTNHCMGFVDYGCRGQRIALCKSESSLYETSLQKAKISCVHLKSTGRLEFREQDP